VITDGPNSSSVQLAQLRRENDRLRTSLQHTSRQAAQETALLCAERTELLEQLKQRDHKIDGLQHQLQMLLRRYFGRSSEKLDPNQKLLFDGLHDLHDLHDLVDKCIPEMPTEVASENEASTKRKGHGRRRLPSNLPREKIIHDLPEKEKPCPCCHRMRHIMGKETHEQLDYIPARVKVIEHVRLKYGCPHCEAAASPEGPQIVVADKPWQPIEKGLAAPGLLSYVIVSKYGDHLPMHRLEGRCIVWKADVSAGRDFEATWDRHCPFNDV